MRNINSVAFEADGAVNARLSQSSLFITLLHKHWYLGPHNEPTLRMTEDTTRGGGGTGVREG